MSTRRRLLTGVTAWTQARRKRNPAADELRSPVQQAPIGIALLDLDQRFVEANATLCEMLGHSVVELEQRTLSDVTHPEDIGLDEALLAELFAGSRLHYEIVKRFVTSEGRILEGTTSLSAARDAAGDITHLVAQIEDVSDVRAARILMQQRVHDDFLTELPSRQILGIRPRSQRSTQPASGPAKLPEPRRARPSVAPTPAEAPAAVVGAPVCTEQTIRAALDQDRVTLAYQPVFDLSSGLMVGVEALLRLTDSDGAAMAPYEAVVIAERSDLIIEIGWRVLQLATAQGGAWRDQYGVIVPIAVNVSAAQLGSGDFPRDVLDAVARVGLPPHALTLELTETVLLGSRSAGSEQLHELRAAGFELTIDDFGTGFASLSYLHELPTSTIKIDQTFVAGLPGDPRAVAIVAGVVSLARSCGVSCIAEGIETDAQRAHLAALGVLGQGYLLGRPGKAAAIGALIAQGRTGLTASATPSDESEYAEFSSLHDSQRVVA